MKESIVKLIDLLNKIRCSVLLSNVLTLDEIKITLDELDYFIDTFKHLEDKIDRSKKIIIFEEFPLLCSIIEQQSKLHDYKFSEAEKFEIIMSVIKRNINTGFLNSKVIESNDQQPNYEEIKEKALYVLICHITINNNYFNKEDYDRNDIQEIEEALLTLGVSESIASSIKTILTNNYNKREYKNNKNKSQLNMQANGIYSLDDYYKRQNEKKKIIKELNNYFDYDHMEFKRPLSTEEKLYCLDLLDKIGISTEEKQKFLKMFENYPQKYNNALAIFADNYEKLKYYEKKYGLQNYMKTLKEYLEFIIICDNDEYADWKNEIENELNQVMKEIPKTYEYELDKNRKSL